MSKIKLNLDKKFIVGKDGFSEFDAVITIDENVYCSLCINLNIASEGLTQKEAKENLLEAVKDYLELAIENKIPILRPVGKDDNPLMNGNNNIVECFKIETNIDLDKFTYAA